MTRAKGAGDEVDRLWELVLEVMDALVLGNAHNYVWHHPYCDRSDRADPGERRKEQHQEECDEGAE